MPKPPTRSKLSPAPQPKPKPAPRKASDDLSKTGRDDGTAGQTGLGFESEISRNPLAKEK